jgi:hypothetical protein
MFNDLSLVSLKRGMGYQKKEREKMACPRSTTQKREKKRKYIFGQMKVQKNKKNNSMAKSSCCPNKREGGP